MLKNFVYLNPWIYLRRDQEPKAQPKSCVDYTDVLTKRYTVKPVLSGHSKRPKIVFQDLLSLNAGQKYCRMLSWSILQYFRPSLSKDFCFVYFRVAA